jgi:hypothetical protein
MEYLTDRERKAVQTLRQSPHEGMCVFGAFFSFTALLYSSKSDGQTDKEV